MQAAFIVANDAEMGQAIYTPARVITKDSESGRNEKGKPSQNRSVTEHYKVIWVF